MLNSSADLPSPSLFGFLLKSLLIPAYTLLLSDQELPHFSVDKLGIFPQLINNEVSHYIPNILWIRLGVFEL